MDSIKIGRFIAQTRKFHKLTQVQLADELQFVPSMSEYTKAPHTLTKRRLTCPKCQKVGMCRHRIAR